MSLGCGQTSTVVASMSTPSANGIAQLLTPPDGATNVDPSVPVQFSWTSVPTAQAYYLYVGTTPGAKDVVNTGEIQVTSWSARMSPLTMYYVRLWTKLNGSWYYHDTTFSTNTGIARLLTPPNGATGVSQFQQFTWNQVADALSYWLIISPTNYDTVDMYNDEFVQSVSSRYVWGLLPNTYYYVTLCTQKVSGQACSNSNFTTGPAGSLPDRQVFYQTVQNLTSQVRLMTQGMSNQATPGTLLYQEMLDHGQDPNSVNCADYTIALLDLMSQNRILGRWRNLSLDGVDTHVIAEYWDPFNTRWEVADATFGLVYFDPHSQLGQGAEDLNARLLAGQLSLITPLFVTNNGSAYMTNYKLDPITLFNNPYPFGHIEDSSLILNYVPNSPLPFLNSSSLDEQGTYGIYVFQFANQADSITINSCGMPGTVTPENTYGWAPGVLLCTGWQVTSQVPPGMNMYTFKRIMF